MPKRGELNGLDKTMEDAVAGAGDRAVEAWSEACELYARYFSALARSGGLEGVLSANTQLMLGAMDVMAQGAAASRKLNGSAANPKA